MKTLTLLRHAKSSWKDTSLTDKERPLNKRGKRDAPMMGKRLSNMGVRPSLIVSSPAVRAWTTAKIVADEISYPREFLQRDERLYLASVRSLMAVPADQDPGFNSIMLVGHNPGLTDFANMLVPGLTPNVPTTGIVAVDIDADDWDLRADPDRELRLYDYPKRIAE